MEIFAAGWSNARFGQQRALEGYCKTQLSHSCSSRLPPASGVPRPPWHSYQQLAEGPLGLILQRVSWVTSGSLPMNLLQPALLCLFLHHCQAAYSMRAEFQPCGAETSYNFNLFLEHQTKQLFFAFGISVILKVPFYPFQQLAINYQFILVKISGQI